MRRYPQLIFMIIIFFLLIACSEKEDIQYFSTKEKAMEHYLESEGIFGTIHLITTTENEQLLVTEYRENNYFVGELKNVDETFYTERISANVVMEIGGSWELITNDKNKYTISFAKTKEDQHFMPLSNNDYLVSLMEGHTISETLTARINAIQKVEVVKE